MGVEKHFEGKRVNLSVDLPPYVNRVSNLINAENRTWDSNLVRTIFSQEEAGEILQLPVSSTGQEDKLIWQHSISGGFNVKTAYHVYHSQSERAPSSGHHLRAQAEVNWKLIWKLGVTPNVRTFVWKVLNNGLVLELIDDHNGLREVWGKLENKYSEQKEKVGFLSTVSWFLWAIWRSRNAMIFREKHDEPAEVVGNAMVLQNEFIRAGQRPPAITRPCTTANAPSEPSGGSSTGVGAVVVRNHRGLAISSATSRYFNVASPAILEAMAMRDAINLAKSLQLTEVIFEGDAKVLIDAMIKNSNVDYNCDVIIQDCKVLAETLMPHSFIFVRRVNNWVAHSLAKKALRDNSFCCNNLAQLVWPDSRLL
ncbi:uncharacterized protein LOC126661954 [Mercurialis annua]|uniref:uncharacterized protein LOC126661954 n=1 Tax=Mercurialis annua TaxID=3986 RepID=UPI00215E7218|nr:uncharacterized protein LOC126661954 [Mercurialis annua]